MPDLARRRHCALLLALLLTVPAARAQFVIEAAVKIDADEGGFPAGLLENADRFGRSVAGLGDLDLDGVVDLAVGARSDDDGGVDAGAVYICFLNANGTVKAAQKISALFGGLPAGLLDGGDFFGYSLALLPDVNGDGIQDLAVGAPNDDDVASNAGAVYVLCLSRAGTVVGHHKITGNQGGLGPVLSLGDSFGMGMAALGDLDGDGMVELGVGAPNADDGGNARGAAYLLFLATDGTVASWRTYSSTSGGFGPGLQDGDSLGGRALANLGDLDGDGRDELAVGAFRDDDGGPDRGAYWVLFLDAAWQVDHKTLVSDTGGGFGGGLADGDLFGMCLAPLGDRDNDGVPDLVVGNNRDDDGGTDRGALFLLRLAADGSVAGRTKLSNSTVSNAPGLYLLDGERFGRALNTVGPLVPGGPTCVAVGAGAGVQGGAVWLLFLTEPGTWTDLGQGLVGSAGVPTLWGSGALLPAQPVSLTLEQARPSAAVTLVFGLGQLTAPFKGGVLVPTPDLLLAGLASDGDGRLELTATWPTGLPAGLELWHQAWIVDPSGFAGLAASNGLRSFAP